MRKKNQGNHLIKNYSFHRQHYFQYFAMADNNSIKGMYPIQSHRLSSFEFNRH